MSGVSVSSENTPADNSAAVANFTFGAQCGQGQGQRQRHNGMQGFSCRTPIGEFL